MARAKVAQWMDGDGFRLSVYFSTNLITSFSNMLVISDKIKLLDLSKSKIMLSYIEMRKSIVVWRDWELIIRCVSFIYLYFFINIIFYSLTISWMHIIFFNYICSLLASLTLPRPPSLLAPNFMCFFS